MYLIASYPRSGNHLVRFLVEYLTGRPTLGSRGNPADLPIHRNGFTDPALLQHVGGEPIARKVHDEPEAARLAQMGASRGSILILRNPTEALLSHVGPELRAPHWLWYPWFLHRLNRGALHYFEIIRGIEVLPQPHIKLCYEDLIADDAEKFQRQLAMLVGMLGTAVIPERADDLRQRYAELRAMNANVTNRDWPGVRSGFDPLYYSRRASPTTVRFVQHCLAARRREILGGHNEGPRLAFAGREQPRSST